MIMNKTSYIVSELRDRNQVAQLEDSKPNKKIQFGVLQGTVLPMDINFSDGTVIFYKDINWITLKQKTEQDFERFEFE